MNYSEIDILNFVEGRLSDEQVLEFLDHQQNDPELAAAVKAMQASQLPIGQAYRQQEIPAVPSALRAQLEFLASRPVLVNPSDNVIEQRNGADDASTYGPSSVFALRRSQAWVGKLMSIGLAACLVVGVGIGVLATQYFMQTEQAGSGGPVQRSAQISSSLKHDRLVKRVADYQSLYVENTVETLSESRMQEARQLLGSINTRSNAESKIPDLTSFGYQFARAQELGFEGQILVQLVYKKPGSAPLALCFMPDNEVQAQPMNVLKRHNLNTASWVVDNQHFVLVADETDAVLKQIHVTAASVL